MRLSVSTTKHSDQYAITWLIRRLFRAMAQNAAERLTKFNISVADRAVLEFLYPDEALTVPDIASRYQVSRQHVQNTVNGLLDQKLLVTRRNPQHKRSRFLVLTRKGKTLFDRIKDDDEKILRKIFAQIEKTDVKQTRETLQTLFDQLTEE